MIKFPNGRNHPFRIIYKNFLRQTLPVKSKTPSKVAIDIIVPVAEKDLASLDLVIKYARENILNPIERIYVVGRRGQIEGFCHKNNCVFINEDTVLRIKKSDIKYESVEWFRSGWLFQQLIKLNADEIASNENVLVLDADTLLITKQSFVSNEGDFVLNFSDEYHHPYGNYKLLLGKTKRFYLSFVCHHMIFNKKILRSLKSDIELHSGMNWIEAILQNIDYKEISCFSEYELYGNYLLNNYRERVCLEYWKNAIVKKENLTSRIIKNYSKSLKSISLHSYAQS